MMRLALALALALALTLGACESVVPSDPNLVTYPLLPKSTPQADAPKGAAPYPNSCSQFDTDEGGHGDNATLTRERNKCINDVFRMADAAYGAYRTNLDTTTAATNLFFDAVSVVAGTAGNATSGSSAKLLTAISNVATGGKSAVANDLLYKSTLPGLENTMDADRSKISTQIRLKMQSPIVAYSIEEAMDDLINYVRAGTLYDAVSHSASDASANATRCQQASDKAKAAQTGAAGGQSQTQALAAGADATGSTGNQCAAMADNITFAYSSTPATLTLDAYWRPGGVFNGAHEKAIDTCMASVLKSNTDATVVDIVRNKDIQSLEINPSVSDANRSAILTCAKKAAP